MLCLWSWKSKYFGVGVEVRVGVGVKFDYKYMLELFWISLKEMGAKKILFQIQLQIVFGILMTKYQLWVVFEIKWKKIKFSWRNKHN